MRSGLLLFTTVLLLLMSSCATPEPTRREPSGRAGAPVTRTVDGYRIQIATTDDLMHLEGLESRFMPLDIRGDDATA